MAHLRSSGPSFGGLVDTLDTTKTSKSNESITAQKHMHRAPTWKTGSEVSFLNTGVAIVPNTNPAQYSHNDFPNTGDQISMSDYRGIFANITAGSASFTSGSNKSLVTETYNGWATQDGLRAASNGNITSSQIGSALSEGTTYTGLPIPLHTNYGTAGHMANNVWCYAALYKVSGILQEHFIIVLGGSGRGSVNSLLDAAARGNGNLLSVSSSGPDGTWNQDNTSTNGGYNQSNVFTSSNPVVTRNINTPSSGQLDKFQYAALGFHVFNRGTGANFTAKLV